jgi:uncharacterized protein YjbI with pentapeptide repeats
MANPKFLEDEAFKYLREGDHEGFCRSVDNRKVVDFTGADLRGSDFRNIDMSKIILRDAYLRNADFRGCDLRKVDLEGASIHNAQIAGAYFPLNIPAEEIQLSIQNGTRIRVLS